MSISDAALYAMHFNASLMQDRGVAMNPSLPPQLSERSSQRWAAERSVVTDRPSCSFEIKRTRLGQSTMALPQEAVAQYAQPNSQTNSQTNSLEKTIAVDTLDVTSAVVDTATHSSSSRSLTSAEEVQYLAAITAPDVPKISSPSPRPSSTSISPLAPTEPPPMERVPLRSLPVPVPPSPAPATTRMAPQAVPPPRPVSSTHSSVNYPSAHKATITVQPFSVQQDAFKEPSLPRLKEVQLNSHRHSHNPLFPLSLLQDIASIVEDWQAQLEHLHEQVQGVYLDGPIVDGWLEAEATLDGVIQGYRLCGLDDQGQMWVRPCPPDQLPGVSTAIARYQHLRQLLAQKQSLEMRFQQLGETLAMVRGNL